MEQEAIKRGRGKEGELLRSRWKRSKNEVIDGGKRNKVM